MLDFCMSINFEHFIYYSLMIVFPKFLNSAIKFDFFATKKNYIIVDKIYIYFQETLTRKALRVCETPDALLDLL